VPKPRLVSNNPLSQIDEAVDNFEHVIRVAEAFKTSEGKTSDLLLEALADLYSFGQELLDKASEKGRNLVRDFFDKKKQPWNKVAQNHPYSALTKLAFGDRSPSSVSQYATVLRYARALKTKPQDFRAWLVAGGGIAGTLAKAVEYFGSTQHQQNSQAKISRLARAETKLMALPHSQPVQLPQGVTADEGFVVLLARVDANNQATIVTLLDQGATALEPILLRFDGNKMTRMSLLAAKPLGNLFRAIDVILGITLDKPQGKPRSIFICNELHAGKPVCSITAVSEAYQFVGACAVLEGHLQGLGPDEGYLLSDTDARTFHSLFEQHECWQITDDTLTAAKLEAKIQLGKPAANQDYRAGIVDYLHAKPLSVPQESLVGIKAYLDGRRADNARFNKSRSQNVPFPSELALAIRNGDLSVRLAAEKGEAATKTALGSASPDRPLAERPLAVADMERLIDTLIPYETDLIGGFIDNDGVEDAAICLELAVGADKMTITLPFLAGNAYQPACEDFAA
jgi:hypothetical protein